MTIDTSDMQKTDDVRGCRAALGVNLAMLGVAILVVHAGVTGRTGNPDMTKSEVSPVMLTLVRGI